MSDVHLKGKDEEYFSGDFPDTRRCEKHSSPFPVKAVGTLVLLLVLPVLLSGCLRSGLIYTNTVRPLTKDFGRTPVGSKRIVLDTQKIREPLSGYDLSAEWQRDRLKKLAEEHGLKEIHYFEQRRFSLFRIYFNNAIIVYGD